jgi:hypothetical protein
MRMSRNTTSADRARMTAVTSVVTGLTLALLAIAAGTPRVTHADTVSPPPVSSCTDFACEK